MSSLSDSCDPLEGDFMKWSYLLPQKRKWILYL